MDEDGSDPAVVTTVWDRLGTELELTAGIEIQTYDSLENFEAFLRSTQNFEADSSPGALPASWWKTCPLGRVRLPSMFTKHQPVLLGWQRELLMPCSPKESRNREYSCSKQRLLFIVV